MSASINPASIAALFSRIQQQFGRLDLLFNNAGTGAPPNGSIAATAPPVRT